MITRFAPSPTGPLHMGHAYSAILAHDMARARGGQFLLRMEDTDLQRSKPHWEALIVEDLQWLSLTWDSPILRQSDHLDRYRSELDKLAAKDLLYPCSCSRKDIQAALAAPQEGVPHDIYPGTCKSRPLNDRRPGDALRLHLDRALTALGPDLPGFVETGQKHEGHHQIDTQTVLRSTGDVVLSRKGEDIVAYFLASALDDATQKITHVVRGEDLFDFSAIQVILLSLLNLPIPTYHHHHLIRDDTGKRLAKRDDARSISTYRKDGLSAVELRRKIGL